jgi:hypothetical protein
MKTPFRCRPSLVAVALLSMLAVRGRAADRPLPPSPPPEAYSACADKKVSDSCSVSLGQQAIGGTCALSESGDGQLFCRPARPPLPPEAFTACADKVADAACTVAFGDHTMQGVCAAHEDGRLFCRPDRPPHER